MNANVQLPIHAFAKLAREFCDWCESESLGPRPNRMAASWLALLYAAALEIPEVELENYDTELEPAIEEVPQVKRNFAGFWGQNYRQIFDPRLDGDELPVVGDLGDDLSGVYADIKSSLQLYDRGSVLEAAWQWRFDHETHWGHHAVGALFGIHHLSVSGLG